jgi:aminopeptidase N
MKILIILLLSAFNNYCLGQHIANNPQKNIYRESATKMNDLIHTNLQASFDYQKAWLNGKIAITLAPHFYPTDSLTLDAKQMDIRKVTLANSKHTSLQYGYDGWQLHIKLDKTYKVNEKYTIYIEYTAKPNEAKVVANGYHGLYFINPDEKIKNKPVQVWTDGEAEFTSYWCPTIDKPNQKGSIEMSITVPSKYITVSNGLLMFQNNNHDGTRTDHWVSNFPLSSYLFFMAIGDFTILKDQYHGK